MAAEDVRVVIERDLALLSFPVRRTVELDELLDPDFRGIGATGRLWTRAGALSALAGELSESAGAIEATQLAGVTLSGGLGISLAQVSSARGPRRR